jgi:hypothetical protein
MDTSLWVILFSKFSQSCQNLLRDINESGLSSHISFEILDIDNKEIRQKIKKNKSFDIKCVPCIIRLENNGVASQYEGQKAFELVYKLINIFMPPPPPPPTQEIVAPQVTFIQQTPTQVSSSQVSSSQVSSSQVSSQNTPSQSTSITDLMNLDEMENDNTPSAPKEEDLEEIPKTKTGKVSVSSIMSAAKTKENQNEHPKNLPRGDEIQSVKTGAKINISEIMANRPKNN